MTYGGTVPALTYTYTGLVNGDTSATSPAAWRPTATSSSSVGSYPITAGDAGRDRQLHDRHVQSGHTDRQLRPSLPPSGTIYVLDPTAGGALTLSGSAGINVPGDVYVDSSSSERHHDQRGRVGQGRRHPGRRRRQEEWEPDLQSPAGDRQQGGRRPARGAPTAGDPVRPDELWLEIRQRQHLRDTPARHLQPDQRLRVPPR